MRRRARTVARSPSAQALATSASTAARPRGAADTATFPSSKASPEQSGGAFLFWKGDLDQRTVADHRLEIVTVPRASDVRQNLATLAVLGDDSRPRRKVCLDATLEVKDEIGVSLEVGQPAP